ncbi:MAG: hypothetical protein HY763_05810 [Planctomycetes bacterium]|nr:hypothetical protein [Planctomycetota bacterium]
MTLLGLLGTVCAANLGGCPVNGIVGNAPPTASNQEVMAAPNTATTITLSASDPDPDDILVFIIGALPSQGTLAEPGGAAITQVPHTLPDSGRAVVYTPASGYTGPDTFTFRVSDGAEESSAATVSIMVTAAQPDRIISEDVTEASLTVAAGELVRVENDAVVTVTGDAAINGTLEAEAGKVTLRVDGALTIDGTIRANGAAPDTGNDTRSLAEQPVGIHIIVGDGAVTLSSNAVLETVGNVLITDDQSTLMRTPGEFFDEVEDVGGDDLPTLVPLPPDNPAFADGAPKVKPGPVLQAGALPPVTVTGVWPPAGAAPPPGDRPVVIFRFTGPRDVNLNNWTVNGPPAPAGPSADESMDGGDNASGGNGRNGMRLNIRNDGGAINIVNNVVLNLTDGGDGGDATAACASATGGNGGNSGNLRMTAAGGIDLTAGTLTINAGRGGNGGAATVVAGAPGANGCPGAAGEASTATGGKGGDNKKRLFVRGNVAGVANITFGPVSGGAGGAADATACDGGDGTACCDGSGGGAAAATGGKGGDASLSVGTLPVTTGAVTGGAGGAATANGGAGGDGGDCKFDDGGDGGAGGAATATGGAGGSAANDGAGGATGGAGGDATANGGNGGNGGDSGFGTPGSGGAGGGATATAGAGGAGTTAGAAGVEVELPGVDGADGEASPVFLYCFGFAFVPATDGAITPGSYEGPVFEQDNTTQIGTLSVEFVDGNNVNYRRGDDPPHIGIANGMLDIDASTLMLDAGEPGVIGGLRIAPLSGFNLSQSSPMQVQALDAAGNVIDTATFDSLPDNTGQTGDLQTVDARFNVDESIATFRIVVPQTAFVTIIQVYLLDP